MIRAKCSTVQTVIYIFVQLVPNKFQLFPQLSQQATMFIEWTHKPWYLSYKNRFAVFLVHLIFYSVFKSQASNLFRFFSFVFAYFLNRKPNLKWKQIHNTIENSPILIRIMDYLAFDWKATHPNNIIKMEKRFNQFLLQIYMAYISFLFMRVNKWVKKCPHKFNQITAPFFTRGSWCFL